MYTYIYIYDTHEYDPLVMTYVSMEHGPVETIDPLKMVDLSIVDESIVSMYQLKMVMDVSIVDDPLKMVMSTFTSG